MPIRNPDIFSALQAYIRSGLSLLSRQCRETDRLTFESDSWVRSGSNTFVKSRVKVFSWGECIGKHLTELHSLPEYSRVVNSLRSDRIIGPQLNAIAQSMHPWIRSVADQVTDGLMVQAADGPGGLNFAEDAFRTTYALVEDALFADATDLEVVAPLQHLDCETIPLQLGPGLTIDSMTDEEISGCIGSGLIRPTIRDTHAAPLESNCAVRLRYRLAKLVGHNVLYDASPINDSDKVVSSIVLALRLFKGGAISSPGFVAVVKDWLSTVGFYHSIEPLLFWIRPKYALSAVEAAAFSQLWQSLNSDGVRRDRGLSNALRRFGYAGERTRRPDDRLVDLIIAAEGLFLSDSGDSEYRGELRYRLALRAAFFVGEERGSQRRVFDLIRLAYAIRSSIVHGDAPRPVRVGDSEVSLDEFASMVEEHVRFALKKRVVMAQSNRRLDWDQLIFGATSGPS